MEWTWTAVHEIKKNTLIKGNVATRYVTSQSVSREITSFDRHHDFAAGKDYCLSKIPNGIRLGSPNRGGTHTGEKGKRKRVIHRTAFVRRLKKI